MPRSLFFSLLFLIACNSADKPVSLLDQPPYKIFTDSIRTMPAEPGPYFRRGVMLYANGEQQAGLADLRQAWKLQPAEEYALALATALREQHADSAIVFLQEALQKLPGNLTLQIGLARGYQQKGELDAAQQLTDRILEQYPGQVDALTLKSSLYHAQEKPTEALAYLEKAHALVPSDPDLAYDLAYEYAEAGNGKVIALTDSLVRAKAPGLEKAHYVRGLYFLNTGKGSEAMQHFDAAIRANYNFFDPYRDKGEWLLQQKKYDAAIKVFEQALQVKPDIAEFYLLIGKAQEAKGARALAKEAYIKAYALDKSLTEAKASAERL